MFTFSPVWLKLLGFEIRNFYHLTPCWSRSLSCIHSIVTICRRTLNQKALCKIPVEKCFNFFAISTYPIKKSDIVTEIMTVLHNYEKKIMKIKCHETHICPTTHKYDQSRKKTRSRKKFAVVTRKYFRNLRKCNTAIPQSIHTIGRI